MTHPQGVRRYLAPQRRELVRIAGIADAQERKWAFRRFWSKHCAGWNRFDPRLSVPRSLRDGFGSPRTWAEPVYGRAR